MGETGEKGDAMILIDTNIFIDHLRDFKPASVFFESLQRRDDVFFPAITEAELIAGSENNDPEKKKVLLRFLSQWHKIEVSNPIAILAGDLKREYNLLLPDAIIAATALHHNIEILTRNTKDFKKIKDLTVRSPY